MEQAVKVRALEQVEAWDKVGAGAADLAALAQAPEETVFVLTVVNDSRIKLGSLALSGNAPSAGPP
jgi:hypothetical protein